MSARAQPRVASTTVQERRRAETLREIKQAALRQIVEAGPTGLSLRGVAREVGMTVQALYHYFPSRDDLLGALVHDAHDDLAAMVQARADATRGEPARVRRLAVAQTYRDWALSHRSAFLLIYGNPLSGFEPVREGRTSEAAWRLAAPFVDAVYDGWTRAELETLPAPADLAPDPPEAQPPLPWGAMALLTELRALMHGLVMLELFGYYPLDQQGEAIFTAAMRRTSDDLDARRAAASAGRQVRP